MDIFVDEKKVSIKGKTVSDMLNEIGVNSESVLVQRDNEIITEDEKLNKNDKLCLISVVSGG